MIRPAVVATLACALASGAAQAAEFAFVGVNVVPMDRELVLPDQTVLVADGRIARIGPRADVAVPETASEVHGEGRWLMPGISEMHAHVPPGDPADPWVEDVLFLYAANGITVARGMLGAPWHLELKANIAAGKVLGPRLYTSGPSLNGNSVSSPEDGARLAREQAAAGYDFLKLHPGLSRAEFDAIAAAADAAGIAFAGHVSEDVGLERALEAGYASIDHLDGYLQALAPDGGEPGFFGLALAGAVDAERIPGLARRTRDAGVWNVPTQTLMVHFALPIPPEALRARPEHAYVPAAMRQRWLEQKAEFVSSRDYDVAQARRFIEVRRQLIDALHAAGAGLLLGSDAPQLLAVPGFSIHHELAELVASGLSPYEALRTGTVAPAEFFGAGSVFGTVREGLEADLVLLGANPLEDVAALKRPAGVMLKGRWLSREALDARLAEIAARYAD